MQDHLRLAVPLVVAWAIACAGQQAHAISISFLATLDHPLAGHSSGSGTRAYGVSGNNVVGLYEDTAGDTHGFVYDGVSYATFDHPLASYPGGYSVAGGIEGDKIVGEFAAGMTTGGFYYDGTSFATIFKPSSLRTAAVDIDGQNIIGGYSDGTYPNFVDHGFLYDGSSFISIDFPSAVHTVATGISGNRIVGHYEDSAGFDHGFLYDGSSYTTIDHPLAVTATQAWSIDGNYIVGWYNDGGGNHGFVYDGSAFLTVDHPLGEATRVYDIDGNKIVGRYRDAGVEFGFIAEIPEPPVVVMLAGAASCLFLPLCRRSKRLAVCPWGRWRRPTLGATVGVMACWLHGVRRPVRSAIGFALAPRYIGQGARSRDKSCSRGAVRIAGGKEPCRRSTQNRACLRSQQRAPPGSRRRTSCADSRITSRCW